MKNEITIRYTQEMKDAVLVRMMPPNNESVKSISDDLGSQHNPFINGEKKHVLTEMQLLEMDRLLSAGVVKISS